MEFVFLISVYSKRNWDFVNVIILGFNIELHAINKSHSNNKPKEKKLICVFEFSFEQQGNPLDIKGCILLANHSQYPIICIAQHTYYWGW
jgi:hypothetical protein